MPSPDYIARLREAIRQIHGVDAAFLETSNVSVILHDKTWVGDVEVFKLRDHPHASRCYAWSSNNPDSEKFIAVLEGGEVQDAGAAVRSTFRSESANKKRGNF